MRATIALVVELLVVLLIVFGFVQVARHSRLSYAENEERRARSRWHRWRFAAYLRRTARMSPCDAALELELDRQRPWFSTALARPSLDEMFPAVAPNDIAAARDLTNHLLDDAVRVAVDVWHRKTETASHAEATLRSRFPAFSRRSVNRALGNAWYNIK